MISIPAFREEGDFTETNHYHTTTISIPAFREEGDNLPNHLKDMLENFNPRLP